MSQFQIRLRRRNIPEFDILEDIKETAAELGSRTLTASQYDERGKFGATTVIRRFQAWNKALEKAGLEISNRQNITNDELFENLANVWTSLGSQPFGRHMSDKATGSLFSLGTYEKRFGSWNNALMAFSEFIQNTSESSDDQYVILPRTSRRTARNVNWRLRAKILVRDACICKMCGDSPARLCCITPDRLAAGFI